MNDASNSVARLLQSTVSDFFGQATIDFVLGVNLNVFAEFAERLETSDPGHLLRLRQIRAEAIETCTAQVLAEGEVRVAAWTLLAPAEPDVVRSPKNSYKEKVLLLSNKAVYSCEYEFTLQKVSLLSRRRAIAEVLADARTTSNPGCKLHPRSHRRHKLTTSRRLHPLLARSRDSQPRRELRHSPPLPRPLNRGTRAHVYHEVLQTRCGRIQVDLGPRRRGEKDCRRRRGQYEIPGVQGLEEGCGARGGE